MTGVEFIPIGNSFDNRFIGTFDGCGFEISNLNIVYSEESAGLFGFIGEDTIIKNVILDSTCSITSSASGVGGIVGTMSKNAASRVENCKNYGTVTSEFGESGDFSSVSASVGGIVGSAAQPQGIIIGCSNYGSVRLTNAGTNYAGGIIGNAGAVTIINCHNIANITAPSAESWSGLGDGSTAGGIAALSQGKIVGCSNSGNITAGLHIGGISGNASQGIIEGCYNRGNVISNSTTANPCAIGGIVGLFYGSYLSDCYNAGEITIVAGLSNVFSGSIAGKASSTVTKEMRNIFFINTDVSNAFGSVYLETAEASPLPSAELKSAATVAALNDYPEPWSLYKVTWAEDSGSANGGYPVIQSVTGISSFYAELKSFTVTLDGKTYTGTIDGSEVSIVLPYGTTTVSPTVTVSDKATVSPADGASVDLSSGTATYTVTAENGKQAIYTVIATIPSSLNGLAALRIFTSNRDLLPSNDYSQSVLTYSTEENDAIIVVSKEVITSAFISAIPAETGSTISASLNGGTTKIIRTVTNLETNGGLVALWGPSLTDTIHPGENTITLTVTPPSGGSGTETTYTLKLTVIPTLETLGLTDADSSTALTLTPAFDKDVLSYTLDVPEGTENLAITAEAYLPNIEDVILPEGCVDGKLPVSGEGFDIKVGKGENVTTYHFAYASLPSYTATVALTPSDAVIAINDPNGNYVRPEADGSYKLTVGYTYQYTAAKVGYTTVTGSFTHDTTADYTLTVTLTEVSGSGQDVAASDWPSFRGNEQNLGVTSAFTPVNTEGSELKWAAALGTGYSNAPSIPILVDGKLIIMSSNKIFKLSLEDGSILQSADMVKSIDWGYTPATYADGMIFAPLTDGTVQAFDAETLESLWVYTDPLGGQSVSPIYYCDGYVYTGFWNSEIHDAAFVCLPVTDENPASGNEAKTALWRDVQLGGFYWAGAVAVGDYLIYGTDDGVREGQNGTAKLISRNRITGVLCDTEELVGDQRSSIAYADGKLYFTTKKGNLYQTALNVDGTFASLNVYQMGGMATGTPVVYNGVVFANCLDGTNQFGDPGLTYALNANDLSLITKAQNKFYNQSSLLLSTAYVDDGKLYLYGTYNGTPGGMEILAYDTSAKTLTVEDFFIPDSDKQEYGICSPICDANGTVYYKNDSAYVFAIANKNADELAVKTTEQLIDAIGTVTLESKAKIDAARAAYDALTDTQKALVTNLATLLTAEAKYEELKAAASQEDIDQAAAKGVDDLIDAIGTVTLESETAITSARAAYDKLTDPQKNLITKLETLTAAEAKLTQLKLDKAAAETVDKTINAIGTVTLESESAITAARAAYDALTDPQKALVKNLAELMVAEAKLEALKNKDNKPDKDKDKTITVTMRLIGAEQATKDVDLGKDSYLPNYVTWIPTTSYTLEKGSTVYDLWVLATGNAGIRSVGAENNYVSTVYAPSGYELSEFTNGKRSGWMYTINGRHPGFGLCEQELSNGDRVIWHYVNDYSYEVEDWFGSDPRWPSLGDGTYWNLWLKAPDSAGSSGGGVAGGEKKDKKDEGAEIAAATVTVTPEVVNGAAQAEVKAEDVSKALEEAPDAKTLTVKVDTEGAASVEADLPADAVKAAADAGVGLNVETEQGTVKLSAADVKAAGGKDLAVSVKSNADGTTSFEVSAGGTAVAANVKVELPAKDGQVLVIVNADGTEEVVKKCVTSDGKVYAEIPAGAKVKVADAQGMTFGDVKETDWFAGAVEFVTSRGIFQGTGDGFQPNAPMNRAMLVTVLQRIAGEKARGENTFGDVEPDAWYADAVIWASENGIVNGTDNGFEPDEPVTREQIATMLYRFMKYLGYDVSASKALSGFPDGGDASPWAKEAMEWAAGVGLFQGDQNGNLNPGGKATRAEVATLVERLIGLMVK